MRDYFGDALNARRSLSECVEARVGRVVQQIAREQLHEDVDAPNWDMFWDWPLPNVHLGVSAEDQPNADKRIPLLLQTPAARRFVSLEPLLGPIDAGGYISRDVLGRNDASGGLDWVIVGGESDEIRLKARPCDVAWIRLAVEQCKAAGVPVFVKQLGSRPVQRVVYGPNGFDARPEDVHVEPIALRDRKGGDPAEWPEDLRVREMPS